jgi:hypothetical protein
MRASIASRSALSVVLLSPFSTSGTPSRAPMYRVTTAIARSSTTVDSGYAAGALDSTLGELLSGLEMQQPLSLDPEYAVLLERAVQAKKERPRESTARWAMRIASQVSGLAD